MPTKIFEMKVPPGSSSMWKAPPGEEIFDPITGRHVIQIHKDHVPHNEPPFTISIFRNENNSLSFTDGIWVWFKEESGPVLTPIIPREFVLLEPEFSLDDIELAEKLIVGNG